MLLGFPLLVSRLNLTYVQLPDFLLVVDFSVIEPDELERNCVTKGGKVELKSPERVVQEQREQNTLMVIYTTPSDIPSSPREPSDPYSGDVMTEQSFGEPTEETKVGSIRLPCNILHANPSLGSGSSALRCTKSSIPSRK